MKNGPIIVLAALAVALAGFAFVQHLNIQHLRAESKMLEVRAEEGLLIGKASADRDRETDALKKRVAELEAKLAAAGEGAGTAVADSGDAKEKEKKKSEGSGDFMKGIAKMMEDPAMKAMMDQQMLLAIDGLYGDFFRELNLSEEEENVLRNLLVEKQTMASQMGFKLLDRSKSPEEREKIARELKEDLDRITGDIKATLGEEAYGSFELFEDSQQERQQLQAYKQTLTAQGLKLPYEVEEQLMTAMYEMRKEFKFSTDFGNDTNPNPEAFLEFDKNSADQFLKEYAKYQGQVYEKAQGILSPEQLEAFQESQVGMRKMQEMGINMTLGFIGEKE